MNGGMDGVIGKLPEDLMSHLSHLAKSGIGKSGFMQEHFHIIISTFHVRLNK